MTTRRGFTLIEMLVVVSIIAILASMLLPALATAKDKAGRVQCINNLKQLGIAIQTYADDHGDQLPGPVWQGFYETYDNNDYKRLPFYLYSYLGVQAPSSTANTVPLARCPVAARKWRSVNTSGNPMTLACPLSYIASITITNINSGTVTRPFGYPYSSPPFYGTNEAPKHTREIANPSLSWALTDADQQNCVVLAGYYPFQPKTPCHGEIRNQLFFDWHVTAVKN